MTSSSPKQAPRHPGHPSTHGHPNIHGNAAFLGAARNDWSVPPQTDSVPPMGAKVLKLKSGKHHGQHSGAYHGSYRRHHDGSASPRDRERDRGPLGGHTSYKPPHERAGGGYAGGYVSRAEEFGGRDRERGRGAQYRSKSTGEPIDLGERRTEPFATTYAADGDRRVKNAYPAKVAPPMILKDELKPLLLEALKEFSESILQPSLRELRGDVRADMSSITKDLTATGRLPGRKDRFRYETPPPLPDPCSLPVLTPDAEQPVKGAILDDPRLPGIPDVDEHARHPPYNYDGALKRVEGNIAPKSQRSNGDSDVVAVSDTRDEEVVRPPQQVLEAPLVRSLDASDSFVDHEKLTNGRHEIMRARADKDLHRHRIYDETYELKRAHTGCDLESSNGSPRSARGTPRKKAIQAVTRTKTGLPERRTSASLEDPLRPFFTFVNAMVASCLTFFRGERTMEEIVDSAAFDNVSGVVILINAITIGVQTDHMARHVTEDVPLPIEILDKGIAVFFLVELILRLYAFRCRFFYMPGFRWNWFDAVLVALQIMEELMRSVIISSGGGVNGSTAAQSATNTGGFKIMRIMRVLRLIRVVRVVRMLRIIGELRSILASVAGSLQSLGWTVVLLVLLMYMVGVYFTQTVTDFRVQFPDETLPEEILEHYQTLGATIYHLYQAVSGGIDWGDMCTPLMESIGMQAGAAFIIYIAFVVLCIMNVVTGVFVDSALKNAQQEDSDFMVTNLTAVFNTTDADQNGRLSLQEFEDSVTRESMRRYFETIDLDPAEAMTLFKLLDVDGSGEVQMEEFVSGCIRLRGQAKAIDVMTIMWENRHYSRVFFRHAVALEKNFDLLFQALDGMCGCLGIVKQLDESSALRPTAADKRAMAMTDGLKLHSKESSGKQEPGVMPTRPSAFAARRPSLAVSSTVLSGGALEEDEFVPSPLRPPSAALTRKVAAAGHSKVYHA